MLLQKTWTSPRRSSFACEESRSNRWQRLRRRTTRLMQEQPGFKGRFSRRGFDPGQPLQSVPTSRLLVVIAFGGSFILNYGVHQRSWARAYLPSTDDQAGGLSSCVFKCYCRRRGPRQEEVRSRAKRADRTDGKRLRRRTTRLMQEQPGFKGSILSTKIRSWSTSAPWTIELSSAK